MKLLSQVNYIRACNWAMHFCELAECPFRYLRSMNTHWIRATLIPSVVPRHLDGCSGTCRPT